MVIAFIVQCIGMVSPCIAEKLNMLLGTTRRQRLQESTWYNSSFLLFFSSRYSRVEAWSYWRSP